MLWPGAGVPGVLGARVPGAGSQGAWGLGARVPGGRELGCLGARLGGGAVLRDGDRMTRPWSNDMTLVK